MLLQEPVILKFGDKEEAIRNKYVYDHLDVLIRDLRSLREDKIKKWRIDKDGLPLKVSKTFPWRGASNIVIQVIASNIDILLAQVLASIYEISPLWPIALVGEWPPEEDSEEQRNAVEEFMSLMGTEKDELDLYRVESVLFDSAIGYGFSVAKVPWVTDYESECVGVYKGTPVYSDIKSQDGPRPEVIPFEDFGCTPKAPTLDDAEFKFHVLHLSKWKLQERAFTGRFDKDKVDAILSIPDRGGVDQVKREQFQRSGVNISDTGNNVNEEWDIYECHYSYWVQTGGQKRKLSVIEFYHFKSKTSMRAIHNWYPGNQNIFVSAQLGYTDRGIYSLGFCEMLEHAQIELTAEHNRYADNETLANTSVFRVDPDVSNRLDSAFSLFPMAVIPARQAEFEVFNIGRAGSNGIDRERQALELVKMRTGVDSGLTAAGGGIVNPKRGIYSAQGTFAALQAGNRRSNLRSNDMRMAHILLGQKFLKQYSEFGIGSKLRYFGEQSKYLRRAFDNVRAGKMRILVKAATASINSEMEKQSDMLLVNMLRQHYMGIAQALQGVGQSPPDLQDYLIKTIIASDTVMRTILRHFKYDEINKIVPEPNIIKKYKEQMQNAARQQREQRRQFAGGIEEASDSNVSGQPLLQAGVQEQGAGIGGVGIPQQQSVIPISKGSAGRPS